MTEQARQNRAYVRRLLEDKQPEFAAVLKIVERQLSGVGKISVYEVCQPPRAGAPERSAGCCGFPAG
jgi:hypothetical protein